MNHDQAMIAKTQALKEKLNDIAVGIIKNANATNNSSDKAHNLLQLTRAAIDIVQEVKKIKSDR